MKQKIFVVALMVLLLSQGKATWADLASAAKHSEPGAHSRDTKPFKFKPKGMKVRVSGTFQITDATDEGNGILDLYGRLYFNNQRVWYILQPYPKEMAKDVRIRTESVVLNVLFNDEKTWAMPVSGFLNDADNPVDGLSADDVLWKSDTTINLKKAFERTIKKEIILTLPGDKAAESADLAIKLENIGGIY